MATSKRERSNRPIALFFDNFGPYHLARLHGAQQVLGKESVIGLQVNACSSEYAWNLAPGSVEARDLETIFKQADDITIFHRIRAVWKHLTRLDPSAIAIAGYSAPEMLAALAWCFWFRRASVLFSDSKEDDSVRGFWKESVKGLIVRRYTAAIVGGRPHVRYLTKLGFPRQAIFTSMATVGNDEYHPDKLKGMPRPLDRPYFLLISRFVAKKNLPFVLDAYAEYRRRLPGENPPWDLIIIGDGELRSKLQAQALALGLASRVHLPGFLQQADQLPYLKHCGAFIHASTIEQWGLVVNEAMAAGRPVFVSRSCGCFEDLIIEGKTGLGFDPIIQTELVTVMLRATTGELPLATLGAAALEHIKRFSPTSFGHALGSAIDYGNERRRPVEGMRGVPIVSCDD